MARANRKENSSAKLKFSTREKKIFKPPVHALSFFVGSSVILFYNVPFTESQEKIFMRDPKIPASLDAHTKLIKSHPGIIHLGEMEKLINVTKFRQASRTYKTCIMLQFQICHFGQRDDCMRPPWMAEGRAMQEHTATLPGCRR